MLNSDRICQQLTNARYFRRCIHRNGEVHERRWRRQLQQPPCSIFEEFLALNYLIQTAAIIRQHILRYEANAGHRILKREQHIGRSRSAQNQLARA